MKSLTTSPPACCGDLVPALRQRRRPRPPIDGRRFSFGVSGKLADDDLVMYDRETGSERKRSPGERIAEPPRGTGLTVLPAAVVEYDAFRAHDGVVLAPAARAGPPATATGRRPSTTTPPRTATTPRTSGSPWRPTAGPEAANGTARTSTRRRSSSVSIPTRPSASRGRSSGAPAAPSRSPSAGRSSSSTPTGSPPSGIPATGSGRSTAASRPTGSPGTGRPARPTTAAGSIPSRRGGRTPSSGRTTTAPTSSRRRRSDRSSTGSDRTPVL